MKGYIECIDCGEVIGEIDEVDYSYYTLYEGKLPQELCKKCEKEYGSY